MLLSSILRILENYNTQPKIGEETKPPPAAAATVAPEETSRDEKTELEIAAASGSTPPVNPDSKIRAGNLSGQNLGELLRTIADLERPPPEQVLDLFE